jgi:hypothetical protein
VEVLGVGEAHRATAQADDEVRCHNLGRETALAVPAADRARARRGYAPADRAFCTSRQPRPARHPPCGPWPA